jgi:hypothetical protein
MCKGQSTLLKHDNIITFKRNTGSYSYSYAIYTGDSMATSELHVGCMPSYKWSSYQNNTLRIKNYTHS